MTLYNVIRWVDENGEVGSVPRLRMKLLGPAMKEKILFSAVTMDTQCSAELLAEARSVASELVGQECPA